MFMYACISSAPVESYLVLTNISGSLALFRYGRGNALSVRAKGYQITGRRNRLRNDGRTFLP